MSYSVTKGDGRVVIIEDQAKAIIGGLTLLGYGFANFGDEIAQNFIKGLENNAGLAEPLSPLVGQFWLQIPLDATTQNKNLRICINGTASTLETRWKTLFSIGPTGDLTLDAYTVRGKPVVNPGGGTTGVGSVVVLDSTNKINPSYIPAQGSVDNASRLQTPRTFGSRNGGLAFDGTQNVPLSTSHIAEGDQPYFTNARARSAISASGAISYDPSSGVISYNPGPSGVTHFNGRAGDVGLSSGDVTGALGYAPLSRNGDQTSGGLGIIDGNFVLTKNGDNPVIAFNPNCYYVYNRASGDHSIYTNGQQVFSAGLANDNLYHNGNHVWHAGYQGSGTGLDSDLLDGQHGSYYLNLANAIGSLPGNAIASATYLDNSGYVVFVNGLVVQWGQFRGNIYSEYTVTVSYPLTMSQTPFVQMATPYLSYFRDRADLWVQKVSEGTGSYGIFGFQSSTKNDQASEGFDWMVLGRI